MQGKARLQASRAGLQCNFWSAFRSLGSSSQLPSPLGMLIITSARLVALIIASPRATFLYTNLLRTHKWAEGKAPTWHSAQVQHIYVIKRYISAGLAGVAAPQRDSMLG